MSQNITIQGASYTDVPSVTLPKTGGGTAWFTDVTPTTAVSSDVANGKLFFQSDGSQSLGTLVPSWTLLASQQYNVNTTSTSAATVGTIQCGASAFTASNIIFVRIRDNNGKREGYFFGSDTILENASAANSSTANFSSPVVSVIRYDSNSLFQIYAGQYGVYAYRLSSDGSLLIRSRYNSSYTLTINGTYTVEVYALSLPTGKTLF